MGVSSTTAPSNLFRKLSSVFLINSSAFAVAGATKQTEILTMNTGLPVLFVPDFVALSNRKQIRDKLLGGEDVSMELEFNGVTLDDEEMRCLKLVRPILEKIGGIGPKYPWLAAEDHSGNIKFQGANESRVVRNGHHVGKAVALKVWQRASKFWAGQGKAPASHEERTDGYGYANKTVSYNQNGVTIGCQTISRSEVEFIARHYDWEPVLA